MIEAGMKLVYCDVGAKMYGLGVPEDLNIFLNDPISKKVF